MEMKEIRELVSILENSSLATLEISEKGKTIKLGKYAASMKANDNLTGKTNDEKYDGDKKYAGDGTSESYEKTKEVLGDTVSSPMVGIFYSKPSPDEKPYVNVGDKVIKGQTLCIIEAMKLMNEIVAERDGTINAIYPVDGDLVEYGQELFIIGD